MDKTFLNIRKEFPLITGSLLNKPVTYLDNSATTQKPKVVIEKLNEYYSKENANIHRGPYDLSLGATKAWEDAHQTVADFINAETYKEIIFVRNTTEGLNLLVNTVGRDMLKKGDIVVISEMEHHSNIVPWLMLQKEIGFKLEYIPVKGDFTLDYAWFEDLVKEKKDKVKIVSLVHISNVLGVKNDVKRIFKTSHKVGAFNILDAAQSIARVPIDVQDIQCDALTISGHKVYAPTGSGAVYINMKTLKDLRPWMGGGEMISSVKKNTYELNDLPWRFEAGTPNIADGIAFATGIKWLKSKVDEVGWDAILDHEQNLIRIFLDQFNGIEWFKHFGPNDHTKKYGAISFNIQGYTFKGCKDILNLETNKQGESISEYLNQNNIAFREGYHCAEPLHDKFCVGPTLRFSFGIYNSEEDVKKATNTLKQAVIQGLN